MASNATVYKAELQVTDLDRHYYASHNLTLAQHPSETDERLMVRLLAFALFADERLAFGRGLSDEDEPALWKRSYSDEIELWIELGQPDESRLRKASGRSRDVVVVGYGGNAAEAWWKRNAAALARLRNLTVLELAPADVQAATALLARGMRLTAMIQDGELQLMDTDRTVAMRPLVRMAPEAA
ncbi:YaeQ family protein [Lysobacter solisilvae (ex Woo and Kim 2020)]|uniref:YaeQ family protein n=1 Tax=Agrilutibacter terrestris TaxID=2865112 RepID=A0A7H0G0A4_9GAMM|nr:YaeQ family protein [Lysobacter terrestris]QNP41720.1 YaeQ family protein [Lysobacter terrestris]